MGTALGGSGLSFLISATIFDTFLHPQPVAKKQVLIFSVFRKKTAARTESRAGFRIPPGLSGRRCRVQFNVVIMLPNPVVFAGLKVDCG